MSRLTERCGNTYVPNENANYEPMNCMDKLGRLEDLEEQGRLIKLLCAVGDTVYWISESDACLFCNGPCYERCEDGALKIKEIPFKLHMLNEIGETIFLTKEEAEAKLKELEGDKE